MEQELNTGKTASENSEKFLESQRELRLIGSEVDRLFLSRHSSPLLPEWNPAESDAIFGPDEVEEGEEKFEEEFDLPKEDSDAAGRAIPVESTQEEPRDEPTPEEENLSRLIEKVQKMREAWSLI